jgi:hypothetical protein
MTTLQAIVLLLLKNYWIFASFFWTYDYRLFLFWIASDDFTIFTCNSVRRYSLCSCFIFQTFLSDLGFILNYLLHLFLP